MKRRSKKVVAGQCVYVYIDYMIRINTVITKEQHKELKRLSYETDKSMAEIIRAAIDAMLEKEVEK